MFFILLFAAEAYSIVKSSVFSLYARILFLDQPVTHCFEIFAIGISIQLAFKVFFDIASCVLETKAHGMMPPMAVFFRTREQWVPFVVFLGFNTVASLAISERMYAVMLRHY